MTYNEAAIALIHHQRVYRTIWDAERELYIKHVTRTTEELSDDGLTTKSIATLSDGTTYAVKDLYLQCPGQLEYEPDLEDDAVSKITFRTRRHGEHTTPKQAQETIDAYEQRIDELEEQVNTIYTAFKEYRIRVNGNAEMDEDIWEKLNTIAKQAEVAISGYTVKKKELVLDKDQIERSKKIFEDNSGKTKDILKQIFNRDVNDNASETDKKQDEENKDAHVSADIANLNKQLTKANYIICSLSADRDRVHKECTRLHQEQNKSNDTIKSLTDEIERVRNDCQHQTYKLYKLRTAYEELHTTLKHILDKWDQGV